MPLVVYCQEHFLTPCPSNMHTHMLTRGNASILGLEKLYATSSKKPSLTPKLDEVPFTGLSAPVLTCVPSDCELLGGKPSLLDLGAQGWNRALHREISGMIC